MCTDPPVISGDPQPPPNTPPACRAGALASCPSIAEALQSARKWWQVWCVDFYRRHHLCLYAGARWFVPSVSKSMHGQGAKKTCPSRARKDPNACPTRSACVKIHARARRNPAQVAPEKTLTPARGGAPASKSMHGQGGVNSMNRISWCPIARKGAVAREFFFGVPSSGSSWRGRRVFFGNYLCPVQYPPRRAWQAREGLAAARAAASGRQFRS